MVQSGFAHTSVMFPDSAWSAGTGSDAISVTKLFPGLLRLERLKNSTKGDQGPAIAYPDRPCDAQIYLHEFD